MRANLRGEIATTPRAQIRAAASDHVCAEFHETEAFAARLAVGDSVI